MTAPALILDLDGTFIRSDLLHESLLILAHQHPDAALLSYRTDVLDFHRAERAAGRRIILATASHHRLAVNVAAHLGLFESITSTAGTQPWRLWPCLQGPALLDHPPMAHPPAPRPPTTPSSSRCATRRATSSPHG